MKAFLSCLFTMLVISAAAQDTFYYNNAGSEVNSRLECDYFRVILQDSINPYRSRHFDYYASGQKKSEYGFYGEGKSILNGKCREWYPSGQLAMEAHFISGQKSGQRLLFWENGRIKRNEVFLEDTLIEGKCYDSTGKETIFFPYETMPEYPGGINALTGFLSQNIRYPAFCRRKGIQGKVMARFDVDQQGAVQNIYIISSPHPQMSREVVRVIGRMPAWIPGQKDGRPIRVVYTLPVTFRLD